MLRRLLLLSPALLGFVLAGLPAMAQGQQRGDDRRHGRDDDGGRRGDNDRRNDRGDDRRRYERDDDRQRSQREQAWRREARRYQRNPPARPPQYARGAGPYRNIHPGARLPNQYRGRYYVVDNWRGHGLQSPPRGYHWIQAGSDYVLVAIATGIILQLLLRD